MQDDGWYSFPPPELGYRAARAVMDGIREYLQTGGGDHGKEIEQLRSSINKSNQEERRLIALYANGAFDEDMLDDQIALIKKSRTSWEKDLAELEQQRAIHKDLQSMEKRV